jgi:hypothetical protein
MNDTIIQSAIWIAAGGIMMLFLRRRRSRKNTR